MLPRRAEATVPLVTRCIGEDLGVSSDEATRIVGRHVQIMRRGYSLGLPTEDVARTIIREEKQRCRGCQDCFFVGG